MGSLSSEDHGRPAYTLLDHSFPRPLPMASVDEMHMRRALELAAKAEAEGEVPVGALIVVGDRVVGEGWNRPVALNDPTAHAEMIALRQAGSALAQYRLLNATVYVTLEPCAMCTAAMVHARVRRLVFGAWDPRQGAAGSAFDLAHSRALNHALDTFGGVLADECSAQLKEFFRRRRSQPGEGPSARDGTAHSSTSK